MTIPASHYKSLETEVVSRISYIIETGQMPADLDPVMRDAVQHSIAISMKRIADRLDQIAEDN